MSCSHPSGLAQGHAQGHGPGCQVPPHASQDSGIETVAVARGSCCLKSTAYRVMLCQEECRSLCPARAPCVLQGLGALEMERNVPSLGGALLAGGAAAVVLFSRRLCPEPAPSPWGSPACRGEGAVLHAGAGCQSPCARQPLSRHQPPPLQVPVGWGLVGSGRTPSPERGMR